MPDLIPLATGPMAIATLETWNNLAGTVNGLTGADTLGQPTVGPRAGIDGRALRRVFCPDADAPPGSVWRLEMAREPWRGAARFRLRPVDGTPGATLAVVEGGPLKMGQVGLAAVSGVTAARVTVTDAGHRWAEPVAGNILESRAWPGPFVLVGPVAASQGPVLAWVSFAGAATATLFPVLMARTGGAAGDESGPCTFTYTVSGFPGGGTLAEDVSPAAGLFRRWAKGAVEAATFGLALWDGSGLKIAWCNEVPRVDTCEEAEEENGG